MNRSVLVVEDDPDCLEATCELLRTNSYDCWTAADGGEALSQLRANGAPSLVLLDVMLPVLTGWEVIEEMRKDPALATTPVVLLSGERDVGRKATALGLAGGLQKPFEIETLMSVVRRLVP